MWKFNDTVRCFFPEQAKRNRTLSFWWNKINKEIGEYHLLIVLSENLEYFPANDQ